MPTWLWLVATDVLDSTKYRASPSRQRSLTSGFGNRKRSAWWRCSHPQALRCCWGVLKQALSERDFVSYFFSLHQKQTQTHSHSVLLLRRCVHDGSLWVLRILVSPAPSSFLMTKALHSAVFPSFSHFVHSWFVSNPLSPGPPRSRLGALLLHRPRWDASKCADPRGF